MNTEKRKKKKDKEKHHDHEHGEKKEKKEKHHDHEHGEKKEKKEKHHDHEHGEKKEKKEKHHDHEHGEKDHDHDHSDHEDHDDHKKGFFKRFDLNTWAILLHYAGDALSSLFILAAGLLIKYFGTQKWTHYVDPVSSLLIVALIVFSTLPLVKQCAVILLQSAPKDFDHKALKKELIGIEGVISTHDNHVWQLVDGMLISSVHLTVVEGSDFNKIAKKVKKILHNHGVHSSSIQPEFVPKEADAKSDACVQNCVPECEEDWCCRKTAELDY